MLQSYKYRTGILQLILCLFIGCLAYGFIQLRYPSPSTFSFQLNQEAQCFLENQKELLQNKNKSKKVYQYPIYYLTPSQAYELGMTPEESQHFFDFRVQFPRKKIYNLDDLQNVLKVSDKRISFFKGKIRYSKFFKNDFKQNNSLKKEFNLGTSFKKIKVKKHINQVTVSELISRHKFPDFLALRVIKYRKLLGGFTDMSQLQSVYGISKKQLLLLNTHYKI